MLTLRMLGGIGLSDTEGRELDALLRQPKHVALLAYLALPRPGTWHRRDSILAAFWAEHDQTRARSTLRSALYTLRGHLPDGAVRSRGHDELSLDADMITTDVAEMADDIAAGRNETALARYGSELLPNLYIADAPEFEKWLERERERVRGMARKAAAQLAERLEKAGDLPRAIDAARRAAELDPDDESAARRWIALLDRAGDRAQAFAVYEKFRNHMSEAFGVRPSAETVALLDAVRTRRDPLTSASTADLALPGTPFNGALSGFGSLPPSTPASAKAASSALRRRWLWVTAPIIIGLLGWIAFRPQGQAAPTSPARSLVVLPMLNETGDPKLAYLASGIAEGIARRLEGIGGITIHSGARSDWSDSIKYDIVTIGREFGSRILLRSTLRMAGDSLEVRASVVDVSTSEERTIAAHRFSTSGTRDAESKLAADIAGAVFRVAIPTLPRNPDRPVNPESYRLTLEGWHQLFLRPPGGAITQRHIAAALFTRAIDIDPSNARAWSGLSSVWASLVVIDAIDFDEGYARASAAATRALVIDSMQGTALANLAIMRALKHQDVAAGWELMRKAQVADPSNPEVFMIKSLILRSARLYDEARDAGRVASQLDPLSSFYANNEGHVEFCAGRAQAALDFYQAVVATNPSDRAARSRLTRALALLGRYDEAIASWRAEALAAGNTALARALAAAEGKEQYWTLRHAEGRKRLAALEQASGHVSPFQLALASFATGDVERGFRELEIAREAQVAPIYRLACQEEIDEVRETPRFAAALKRIGSLRVR